MYDSIPQRAVLRAYSQECTPNFHNGLGVSLCDVGPPADRILYEKIRSVRPEVPSRRSRGLHAQPVHDLGRY